MLSDISQVQKIGYRIPLYEISKRGKSTEIGEWGLATDGHWKVGWHDESVLKLNCGDGYAIL